MPALETHYLIDFENVHEAGLSGAEKLGGQDHIHLFSTKNAPSISFEALAQFNSSNFSVHVIPDGNQSLDMHLVSYLGYLIGKNKSNECKYIIISKDTDYDKVISFWKKENASNVSRQTKISAGKKKKQSTNTTESNNEIKKILSNAKLDNKIITYVSSLVDKHHAEKNAKQTIYRAIIAEYGQNQGLNIYNHIKKSI